jgi:HK97 family phage prohead protease
MNQLERKAISFSLKAESLKEGEFAGYGAAFSNLDRVGDIIAYGAFRDTIPEFLSTGVIAWQHDWDTPIGKAIEAYEDEHGLFIRAKISDTSQGRDALTLLRDGVIKKLSIGFRIKDAEFFDSLDELAAYARANNIALKLDNLEGVVGGVRLIKAIDLYEISLVTVPANPAASVTAVKELDALIGDLPAGLPFAKHSEMVRAAVEEFANRASEIQELRRKEGRVLSNANRQKLQSVVEAWAAGQEAINSINELLASTDPAEKNKANHEARKLYAQFLQQEAARLSAV